MMETGQLAVKKGAGIKRQRQEPKETVSLSPSKLEERDNVSGLKTVDEADEANEGTEAVK